MTEETTDDQNIAVGVMGGLILGWMVGPQYIGWLIPAIFVVLIFLDVKENRRKHD